MEHQIGCFRESESGGTGNRRAGGASTTGPRQSPPPRARSGADPAIVAARTLLLGRSEGGQPIVVVHAGDPRGTRVLIVGCIHGTECAGIAIARLLERARTRADLWIVPDLNPDGHAIGARQDGRGVDLNANWSSQLHGGGRPWDVYYPGPRRFPNARRDSRATSSCASART